MRVPSSLPRAGLRAGGKLPAGRVIAALALAMTAPAPAVLVSLSPSRAEAFVWPNVPDRIERELRSGDVTMRRRAAGRLLELPRATALELARSALADPDVEVRLRIAEALIALRVPAAGDLVVGWLGAGDARLRAAACEVVRAAPTDRSVAALGRVLSDPDASVRQAAAAALGGSARAEAVPPLLGHLDDPSTEVRAEVARALGRLGDRRAVLPLVGKVQDSSPEVRRAAARALGELGDARASSALVLALQDSGHEVRIEALAALGKLRSDDATLSIAPLVEADEAPSPLAALAPGSRASGPGTAEVKAAAIRALGAIGSEAAVGVLVAALREDDPASPRSAVRAALVRAGIAAGPALVRLLGGSPTPRAASGAALALAEIGAEGAHAAIARAMQRGIVPLRDGVRALGRLGERASLPTVLELLDDPDPSVRKEAIAAASALLDPAEPDGRAVDPARLAIVDVRTPLDERIELARMLGRTGSARAKEVLLPLATVKQVPLRIAALSALGTLRLPGPVVEATLLEALEDDVAAVRFEAAFALGRSAGPGTADKLLARLARAAEQDRGALGVALSGALAAAKDPGVARRAGALVARAPEPARDAILEGLGRMNAPEAGRVLAALPRAGIDDRRKIAEALAGHPETEGLLFRLLGDPDPTVRASAAWSLGAVGRKGALGPLAARLRDADVTVAGNAAASLGRLARRHAGGAPRVVPALCGALEDRRAYVRANALSALGLFGAPCGPGVVRGLLARDPSEVVRMAAAAYLRATLARAAAPAGETGKAKASADPADPSADVRALRRCASDDRNATVAARCAEEAPSPSGEEPVLVFVVADGRDAPTPRAPFALVLADGLMRLGVADRRGAVFERAAPAGPIRLAVPAPLAR